MNAEGGEDSAEPAAAWHSQWEYPHSSAQERRAGRPVALSIAGSDSGGGAGIQADLLTFAALGVFGTSAVTCVTAQNPDQVAGVEPIDPQFVSLQIRTVSEGFPLDAAKTGMLYTAEVVRAVSEAVRTCRISPLVVDPVMVASSGARLLRDEGVEVMQSELLPMASVITPNREEAEILWGQAIDSLEAARSAARELGERLGVACVVKGGHLPDARRQENRGTGGRCVTDVFFSDGEVRELVVPRIEAPETHGTGCTYAAAVAAWLARGASLHRAVANAQTLVGEALRHAVRAGRHFPLGWMRAQGVE